MKQYIAFTPSTKTIIQNADLLYIRKYLTDGKLVKTYKGPDKLNAAVNWVLKVEGILIVSKSQHLGETTKDALKLLKKLGPDRLYCCDMPYLDEQSIRFVFAYTERVLEYKNMHIKAVLNHLKATGHKLGNPQHLTLEMKKKGALANKLKSMNDPANRKAYPEIKRLREIGATLEAIATHLNDLGYKTPKGERWLSGSVYRVLNRGASEE